MAKPDPYQLHFRLPEEIGKQIDRYANHVKKVMGAELSRTDATLAIIRRGLAAWDETQPQKKGGGAS